MPQLPPSSGCDFDALLSPAHKYLVAYNVTKEPVKGCFLSQRAGLKPTDVYIIDLEKATREDESSSTAGKTPPPQVFLSMKPKAGAGDPDQPVNRSMTLILISRQTVSWYLESVRLGGDLNVIFNDGEVRDSSLSPDQFLKPIKYDQPVPQTISAIWQMAIEQTGSTPVAYLKLEAANVLSMVIPTKTPQTGT